MCGFVYLAFTQIVLMLQFPVCLLEQLQNKPVVLFSELLPVISVNIGLVLDQMLQLFTITHRLWTHYGNNAKFTLSITLKCVMLLYSL